jgi:hypothetical protein
VGSNSKPTSGEFVSVENGFNINYPHNRRLKRLIDIAISFVGLATFPVHLLFVKKPIAFLGNCFNILFAQKTWIGYTIKENNLPHLRKAVIACNGIPASIPQQLPPENLQIIDYWYAKDYAPINDLKLIKRSYRSLGG